MKFKMPQPGFLTFHELRERWQCTDNQLRHAIVSSEIKPAILFDGHLAIPDWIEDEFDELSGELYQILPDGTFRIHARMEIDDVNELLPFDLPEGTFETLGGFLLSEFRRIPSIGESLEFQGFLFIVEDATERSILWVQVRKT